MVDIRGAQRPVRAMLFGLCIATTGLFVASKIGPHKGNPEKECTPTECTVNFPAEAAGGKTTGIGSIVVFGVQVHLGQLENERAEMLIGSRTLYLPKGKVLTAAGLTVELKRTASDGAIISIKKAAGG